MDRNRESNNNSIPKILITLFLSLSIYELIIILKYINIVNDKNNFENNVLSFVTIRCSLNILFCIYIYYFYILNNKGNKLYDTCKCIIFMFNGFILHFYDNINKCGIFKIIILIEFFIFMMWCVLIASLFILVCLVILLYKMDESHHNRTNISQVIINIPQIAVPDNNIELVNIQIPEAREINISIGTRI